MTEREVAHVDGQLASVLPAGSLYAVGGRVRDEVRAAVEGACYPLKDLDYVVVGLALDELMRRLSGVGRTELVGARFAIVKCALAGATVDVALPRRERSTGLGHRDFEVVQSGPEVTLEEDLARRDFRINMLARAIHAGELVDPYGGEADIRARRIDVLREEAFEEDPLRMLRACQFAARFEYAITPRTMAAMRRAAPLVSTVSAERARDELIKLLSARHPSAGFEAMRDGGILAVLLPELLAGYGVAQNEWHAYDVYHHTLATVDAAAAGDLTVRLAALFHDIAKPQTKEGEHFYRHEVVGETVARDVLTRLRFPNDQIAAVARLVRAHMFDANPRWTDKAVRRFVHRVGPENLDALFALRAADIAGSGLPKRDGRNECFAQRVRGVMAERPPFSVRDLAIGGTEVIAALVEAGRLPRGSRGGPPVGEVLRALLERVLDEPGLNEPDALRRELRRVISAGGAERPAERTT